MDTISNLFICTVHFTRRLYSYHLSTNNNDTTTTTNNNNDNNNNKHPQVCHRLKDRGLPLTTAQIRNPPNQAKVLLKCHLKLSFAFDANVLTCNCIKN